MDAVITYVNGNDPVWKKDYEKTTNVPVMDKRFRDWGTLKYLLRGIETKMPFIRNVYLVVSHSSQVPAWVNDSELKIVLHKDIKITYTGLRPGEKLYEELLNQKETTIPTKHKKILVAKVREYDFDIVSEQIAQLIDLAEHGKVYPTVQTMKDIVPEFKSKNSIYEQLDK